MISWGKTNGNNWIIAQTKLGLVKITIIAPTKALVEGANENRSIQINNENYFVEAVFNKVDGGWSFVKNESMPIDKIHDDGWMHGGDDKTKSKIVKELCKTLKKYIKPKTLIEAEIAINEKELEQTDLEIAAIHARLDEAYKNQKKVEVRLGEAHCKLLRLDYGN